MVKSIAVVPALAATALGAALDWSSSPFGGANSAWSVSDPFASWPPRSSGYPSVTDSECIDVGPGCRELRLLQLVEQFRSQFRLLRL